MIQPVNALAPKVFFKGRKNELDNPVNRKLEKRLAILNAGGISAVAGALTTAIARSYTASWKNAGMFGVGAALVTMMFICPRFMYKSGINSYKKEKELDVFTKEKESYKAHSLQHPRRRLWMQFLLQQVQERQMLSGLYYLQVNLKIRQHNLLHYL